MDPICDGGAWSVGTPSPSRSAYTSLRRAVSRSDNRRELANTMDDRWSSTRSTICASTCGQIDPCWGAAEADPSCGSVVPSSVMSSTGTRTERSKVLGDAGATMRMGAEPVRNRPTSSCGRTVAESPMRCAGRSNAASSRSSDNARWAPRLVPATACTSSTMTVSTVRNVSRAAEVNMRNNDSGVVMRMSGGVLSMARRSAGLVSPERTPTEISGGATPWSLAVCVIPTRGERRFRSTSTASALSGDTYSTRVPRSASSSVPAPRWTSRSSAQRNAERVLPEPVGATTNVWAPLEMESHAPS